MSVNFDAKIIELVKPGYLFTSCKTQLEIGASESHGVLREAQRDHLKINLCCTPFTEKFRT